MAPALLAVAGAALAIAFFAGRDDATTVAVAPGERSADPPALAADLRRGNVVLAVADRSDATAARALARQVAGPPSRALRAAGQAVLVRGPDAAQRGAPRPTCADAEGAARPCRSVTAYAHHRRLRAFAVDDPALRAFVEYWLGR